MYIISNKYVKPRTWNEYVKKKERKRKAESSCNAIKYVTRSYTLIEENVGL
jgi:hypothetical protein